MANRSEVIQFLLILILSLSVSFFDERLSTVRTGRSPVSSPVSQFQQCIKTSSSGPLQIVYSGDANYEIAKLQENRMINLSPAAIAYCQSQDNVISVTKCAYSAGLNIAARSGGHDYEGYSLGHGNQAIVVDVSQMSSVQVDANAQTATVQGGVRLGKLYYSIHEVYHTLAFPGGSCPSVGVVGLLLGGGFGLLGRKFGLASDSLLEITIVDVKGSVIVSSATQNTDLFWASQGGGGGNFGVVTSMKLKLARVPDTVTSVQHVWTFNDNVISVISAWQDWLATAPAEVTATIYINSQWSVSLSAVYLGSQQEAASAFASLLSKVPKPDVSSNMYTEQYIYSVLRFGQMSTSSPSDLANFASQQSPNSFKAKSDYITTKLSLDALAIVKLHLATAGTEGYLVIDGYGAQASAANSASAFAHRDVLFCIQYQATTNSIAPITPALFSWINNFYAAMRPFVSGRSYVNYIDDDVSNFSAYFGNNYAKLMDVKRKYDPNGYMQGSLKLGFTAAGTSKVPTSTVSIVGSSSTASVDGATPGQGKNFGTSQIVSTTAPTHISTSSASRISVFGILF